MFQNSADGSCAGRAHGSTGSARLMLRHERMSVAMALADKLHHSAYRSVPLKEELVEHEKLNAPRGQKTASGMETEFFDVFDEELGGGRPPPLPEVAGPQARVLRRTVEPIIESFVPVPMIDAPVPQMVDQAAEVVRFFASLLVVAEQVIEVPTIILEDPIPQRALLRAPQLAEQLVEVPTTPGYAFAVVAVQTLGSLAARALFEQLTASPGRDTNTGQG